MIDKCVSTNINGTARLKCHRVYAFFHRNEKRMAMMFTLTNQNVWKWRGKVKVKRGTKKQSKFAYLKKASENIHQYRWSWQCWFAPKKNGYDFFSLADGDHWTLSFLCAVNYEQQHGTEQTFCSNYLAVFPFRFPMFCERVVGEWKTQHVRRHRVRAQFLFCRFDASPHRSSRRKNKKNVFFIYISHRPKTVHRRPEFSTIVRHSRTQTQHCHRLNWSTACGVFLTANWIKRVITTLHGARILLMFRCHNFFALPFSLLRTFLSSFEHKK